MAALERINDQYESISIKNFLSIKESKVQLANITAVIGPQASGKSVIAKLFYFGRTYLTEYFNTVFTEEFDTRAFKRRQLEDFGSLFGGLDGFDGVFHIQYELDDCKLEIERNTPAGKPKIKQSKKVGSIGLKLKREYVRFINNAEEEGARSRSSMFEFRRSSSAVKDFFSSIPRVLFVPASRSFYATVSEELFTFLASDERVDPLTAQFGSFYEFAKRRIGGDLHSLGVGKPKNTNYQKTIEPVIDGRFVREKSRDFIETKWGRVPLRSASSGQQEALPLLFSLLEYPTRAQTSQLLVIEEPEAHLFPEAQKYVLDLIVDVATTNSCNILFTTHSPYVLACLNTHIARLSKEPRPKEREVNVCAYLANGGKTISIIDEEDLIDTNLLDEVSEEIATEFLRAIE